MAPKKFDEKTISAISVQILLAVPLVVLTILDGSAKPFALPYTSRIPALQNWLSKRLTPAKSKEARWGSFASVLETIWEEHFDPLHSRLERLRSSYLADDVDLAKKVREMGDYFAYDMPQMQDRPVAVAWRRLELEYKDMELILDSVFRRHFGHISTTWFPIFALGTVPYGDRFEVAQGPWPERKNVPPSGMWLTSRGMLGTDHAWVLRQGTSKADFLDVAVPLLMRTKPLHIVYDGPLWYMYYELPVEFDFGVPIWERESWYELLFGAVGSRFDLTPADTAPLDRASMTCWGERENTVAFALMPLGYQALNVEHHVNMGVFHLPMQIVCIIKKWKNESRYQLPFEMAPDHSIQISRGEHENFIAIPLLPYGRQIWNLDHFMPEGFSHDWIPLDSAMHGVEFQLAHPLSFVLGETRRHWRLEQTPSSISLTSGEIATSASLGFDAAPIFDLHTVSNTYPTLDMISEKNMPLSFFGAESEWRNLLSVNKPVSRFSSGIDVLGKMKCPPLSTTYTHTTASTIPVNFDVLNSCTQLCPHIEAETSAPMPVAVNAFYGGCERGTILGAANFLDALSLQTERNATTAMRHYNLTRLDTYPRFDQVPADFAPLDIPAGGFYA